jgi:hemolysin III
VPRAKRPQSTGEEIANSVTHGLGVLAVLTGAPFLILAAVRHHSAWDVVGSSVFLASMLTLYLSSTLYHALTHPGAKRVFHVLDHGAIYLLIAGTYTPFTLGVLRGPWGWSLFGVVWGFAALGITLKALRALWHPVLSNAVYLVMGWVALAAARPFWQHVRPAGLLWLLAGGVAYSGGVVFYNSTRRYSHALWHLCVLAGTVCHFFAVLWYAG